MKAGVTASCRIWRALFIILSFPVRMPAADADVRITKSCAAKGQGRRRRIAMAECEYLLSKAGPDYNG